MYDTTQVQYRVTEVITQSILLNIGPLIVQKPQLTAAVLRMPVLSNVVQ